MAIDITERFVKQFDLYHPVYNPTGDRAGMATRKQAATVVVAAAEEVPAVVAEAEAVVEETEELGEEVPAIVVRKFDPIGKLIKVKGGQLYLQVRDRLIWIRSEHPEARIETYLINYYPDNEMWVVRAEVRILLDNGSEAIGTGHGQETERDFSAGALEKAETKAIGRALATLGYGTQFALEMDEGSLADAPAAAAQRTALQQEGRQYINPGSDGPRRTAAGVEELREDVIALLAVDTDAAQKLPKGAGQMTEEELSRTIVWLRARANRG